MADVVSGEEILERVSKVHPLIEDKPDPTGGRTALSLRRRWRRARRDHVGEPSVLRRLHPRASRSGWEALHLSLRHRPASTSVNRCDRGRATTSCDMSSPIAGPGATIGTQSCAVSASLTASGSRCRTSAAESVADVTVLVFGPLRERVGTGEIQVDGATVQDVWDEVVRRHPAAGVDAASVRAARNLNYCEWTTAVQSGDIIAFIPPVAGGERGPFASPRLGHGRTDRCGIRDRERRVVPRWGRCDVRRSRAR